MKRVYKLRPDRPDKRDLLFHKVFARTAALPTSVDLRPMCSSVVDQGELGSCTANAMASGLREYLQNQAKQQPFTPMSRLFLYYQERAMEGNINTDSGASISDGMMAMQKIGVCPETDDPYVVANFTAPPSPKAIKDAMPFKIANYYRIANLQALKQSLASGLPVVIGIDVYESFESDAVSKTGVVPMPKKGEQYLGGHAVLVVGYQDTKVGFFSNMLGLGSKGKVIVRNSWGPTWGDKGYFYMDYKVFNKLVNDMWTGK